MFGFRWDKDAFEQDMKVVSNDLEVAGKAGLEMAGRCLATIGLFLMNKADGKSDDKPKD